MVELVPELQALRRLEPSLVASLQRSYFWASQTRHEGTHYVGRYILSSVHDASKFDMNGIVQVDACATLS